MAGGARAARAELPVPPIRETAAPQPIAQRIEIEPGELEKVSQIVGSLLEEQARREREFASVHSLVERQRAELERVAAAWQQVAATTRLADMAQRNRFSELTMLLSALRTENQQLRSVLRLSREQGFSAALHLGELEERLRS